MALIVLVFITTATALSLLRLQASPGTKAAPLGWMSDQWLDEHRAAHPP